MLDTGKEIGLGAGYDCKDCLVEPPFSSWLGWGWGWISEHSFCLVSTG